jgi:hypothetical protein
LTHFGPLASGIPGFVAGTWALKQRLGMLTALLVDYQERENAGEFFQLEKRCKKFSLEKTSRKKQFARKIV